MPSDNRSRYGPSTTGKPKSTISKASSSASSYYPAGSSVYQQSGKDSYSTIGSEVSRSTARSGAGGSAVSSDHRDISQRMQQANFDDDVRSAYPERDPARPQASRGYEDDETAVATDRYYNTVERRPRRAEGRSEGSLSNIYLSLTSATRRYQDDFEDERDTVGNGSRVKRIGPNANDLPMSQQVISYDLPSNRGRLTNEERDADARIEAMIRYKREAEGRSQIDYESDESVDPCESASQVSSSRRSPVRSEVSRTSDRSRRSGRSSDARSNTTAETSVSTGSKGSKRSQRPQGDDAGSEVSRTSERSGRRERESNNGSTVSKTSSVQSTESKCSKGSYTSQPDYEDSVAGSAVSKNTYTAIEKAGQAMLPNRGMAPANNGSTVSKATSVQSKESKRSKGSNAPPRDYEDSVAGSEVSRSTYTASEKGARQTSPRGRRPIVKSAANNTYGPNDGPAAASVRSDKSRFNKRDLRSPPLEKRS
ncbi:hypothetical protein LTR37_009455 [Vermiconidia calcicola]|uniref:Uncharacterized protein n=1 Tax=Vermiconidia calcicola TaxID=1690605 RepID=A0ACC3N7U8_9PEZI|nr:hypothetical protein LTR37_009455 [Vermiconidia calcicola]